jgi:hypothetical protein
LSDGLNGAQTTVHIAKQNVIDLSRAVERQAGLIAAAQERLAQAYDLEVRETAAADREEAADNVEAAAAELQRAIEAVAQACDRLAAAIPQGALDIRGIAEPTIWGRAGYSPEQPLNAIEITRSILAEALYAREPALLEVIARNHDILVQLPLLTRRAGKVARAIQREEIEFLDAVGSARAYVADPLRRLAGDVRAGVAPLDMPASPAVPAPPPPAPMPVTNVCFLKPVRWVNQDGTTGKNDGWPCGGVPVTVAERAIQLGVAVAADSPEAAAHVRYRTDRGDDIVGWAYPGNDAIERIDLESA